MEMSTMWMMWKVVVTVWLIVLTIFVAQPTWVSKFSNPTDTQYSTRFQAGPDGVSLNDRMIAAQQSAPAGTVSGLTGSRDIPVFFQDYDIDMQTKGGNIYNKREGFGGPHDKDCGIPGAC